MKHRAELQLEELQAFKGFDIEIEESYKKSQQKEKENLDQETQLKIHQL